MLAPLNSMGKVTTSMSVWRWKDGEAPRVQFNRVFQNGNTSIRYIKSDAWNNLSPSLLSDEAKRIISEDPDLNPKTLKKLIDLNGGSVYQISLFLDEQTCDPKKAEVGRSLLSSCIKENINATWAEFVAHVVKLFRFPYIDTAVALRLYGQQHDFVYYANGSYRQIRWAPKKARIEDTDFARTSCMADDWRDIA